MTYLIGQILFCLFFASMTGFAVGWLFRGGARDDRPAATSEAARAALRAENAQLRSRLESGVGRLRAIEKKLAAQQAAGHGANTADSAELVQRLDRERERADTLEASLQETQTALAEKARALANRDALLTKQSDTLQSLERRLASNSEVIKSASAAAEKSRLGAATANRIAEQLSAMDLRLRNYDSECSRHDATIEQLGKNIAAVTEQAIAMRSQVSGARQRLSAAEAHAESRAESRARAQSESDPALATRLASAREQIDKMQTEALERDQVIAALRTRLQTASEEAAQPEEPAALTNPSAKPPWLLAAPDGQADDLKQIYGIGPVLERTLNDLGVFHFHQVARLSATDVAWLAARINSFPDRIIRDRWVEQAQELA